MDRLDKHPHDRINGVPASGPLAPPAELRRLLAGATPHHTADSSDLRMAVCAYMRNLRDAELSPERAVIAVKHVLEDAGIPRSSGKADMALAATIVSWCIDEYYRVD